MEILREDESQPVKHDGTLEHLLGRWCFRIAAISWLERKLAATLISELPDARKFFV
jgi:hypothetical protein